jgi:hypothetical protein
MIVRWIIAYFSIQIEGLIIMVILDIPLINKHISLYYSNKESINLQQDWFTIFFVQACLNLLSFQILYFNKIIQWDPFIVMQFSNLKMHQHYYSSKEIAVYFI